MFGARESVGVIALGVSCEVANFKKRITRPNWDVGLQRMGEVNDTPSG